MSISQSIFQKDLYQLTRQDLEEFFATEQEETSVLEFKEGSIDIEKLHKEVSAFLNTDGGLLIIGAPREQTLPGKTNKVCIGKITPCTIKNQDTILHALGSNIAPGPAGIRIKTIEIEGGNVYVIEVPQSLTPPHQVSKNGVYYLRLEREAKPAPHGLVEALFQKRQRPDLKVAFNFDIDPHNSMRNIASFVLSNDSIVSADNTGHIYTAYGIGAIHSLKNLKDEPILDECFSTQFQDSNSIFVKGTVREYILEFESLYSMVLFRFLYYCRDQETKVVQALVNIRKNEITIYEGILTDKEQDEVEAKYNKAKKSDWHNLLNPQMEPILRPGASTDQLIKLEQLLKFDLPVSFEDFLLFTNGYEGQIGDRIISLFSADMLINNRKKVTYDRNNNLTKNDIGCVIGMIDDWEILMIKRERQKYSFGLLYTNDKPRSHEHIKEERYEEICNSLYLLIYKCSNKTI